MRHRKPQARELFFEVKRQIGVSEVSVGSMVRFEVFGQAEYSD